MSVYSVVAHSLPASRGPVSLGRVWAAAFAMIEARQTRKLLAEMDPRMMADIGVSRAQAVNESNRAFWDL